MPGDRQIKTDVVVVGSGAGGAMAARELSARGLRVLVLEEGPALSPNHMTQREDEMMPLLYQERGARCTADMAIRIIGGRCVGGSTVHNINLCKRTPAEILSQWELEHRVSGCSAQALDSSFAAVEAELSVTDIPAGDRNANNRVLERGVQALGWRGGGVRHNRVGCQRSGFCEIGCPFDAKQNASKVLLPEAERHGTQVLCDVRVLRVLHSGGQATGVEAVVLDETGRSQGHILVSAAAVVLAGSAIGSAVVAGRSRLPDPYGRLGFGLRLHPGVAVAGLFDESICGWRGIPQSYECTEWLDFSGGAGSEEQSHEIGKWRNGRWEGPRRVWITTVFAHPIGTSVMLPGFGASHREWMARYSHMAVLTAMVHDVTSGHVGVRPDGRARISYSLCDADRAQLALGLRACSELLFAAGARRVLVPSTPPQVLENVAQTASISPDCVLPHSIAITSVHPLGSLPMGDDPRRAVVKSTAEHHQIAGLFVMDGSLFPTSIGVPPQISIYSIVRHLAPHVAAKFGL